MSFILDALKKSELERQRQSSPGLIEAGVGRPRSRLPLWAIALMVLLGVNLVALAIVASRGGLFGHRGVAAIPAPAARPAASPATGATGATDVSAATGPTGPTGPTGSIGATRAGGGPGPASAVASASGPRASPAATAVATVPAQDAPATGVIASEANGHFSPMDGAPEYAPEIPVAQNEARAPAAPRAAHPRDRPLAAPQPIDEPPDEVLPSISEINMTGPELHLDVHVYATQPAERFVYINMRKYREGQALEEGPTVERIRRDGVVLSYQGIRFLLPRQH